MSRPLRFFKPDGIYFISGRCLQGRLLLRPSDDANAIIAGVLAKALSLFNIQLFAFVFASNHFHLLLKSEALQIPDFMQYLRSNIAKKLGQSVDWTGKFFDRRYDAEPVLDDRAAIQRLRYILAHGVKEGLVARCAHWPGLSSLHELTGGSLRRFPWPSSRRIRDNAKEPEVLYPLTITPLPSLSPLDAVTHRAFVAELIKDIEHEGALQRGRRPVLGRAIVLAQKPHDKPQNIKHSPRPPCHATTKEAREAYLAEYAEFAEAYAVASSEHRRVGTLVQFPLFSYHPPGLKPVTLAAA